jgi:hypothetical protein
MTTLMTIEEALSAFHVLVEQFELATPILSVGLSDGMSNVPLSDISDHPTDALATLVSLMRNQRVERPTWALFSAEVFIQEFPDTESVRSLHRGDLAAHAAAGDTAVADAVVCHLVTRTDGLMWSVTQKFRRVPTLGVVEWEPYVRMDVPGNHVLAGEVPRLMAELVGVGKNYG